MVKKIFNKIKCFLGFHSTIEKDGVTRCEHCDCSIIRTITEETLEKMVHSGELPLKGYLAAMGRGHLIKEDFDGNKDIFDLFN